MTEVKIVLKGENAGAVEQVKALAKELGVLDDQADQAGDKLKKTGDNAGQAGGQAKKSSVNFQELGQKFLEMAQSAENVGDILEGIASNDLEKFRSGFESATRAAVSGISMISPKLGALVAALAVVIQKTIEWYTGMEDAARKSEELAGVLDHQIERIKRIAELDKARAGSAKEAAAIELAALKETAEALNQKVIESQEDVELQAKIYEDLANVKHQIQVKEAQQRTAYLAEMRKIADEDAEKHFKDLDEKAEREQKAGEKANERQQKSAEDLAKLSEEARKKELEAETQQAIDLFASEEEFHAKQLELEQQKADEDIARQEMRAELDAANLERKWEDVQTEIEQLETLGISEELAAEKTKQLLQSVADSEVYSAEIRKQARAKLLDFAKKAQADTKKVLETEIKDQQDAAKRNTETVTKWGSILFDTNKSTNEKIKALASELTAYVTAKLQEQLAAYIAKKTAEKAAALAGIGPKSVEANAFLPFPASAIAAAAAIAALSLLANKVFGGGFARGGTIPGLGMQDSVPLGQGSVGMPGEEVLNRDVSEQHRSFLKDLNATGDLAGAAARAGTSGAGAMTLHLIHEFKAGWPAPEEWARQAAPAIAKALNDAVLTDKVLLIANRWTH